jgi:hypothetical protein
MKDRVGQGVDAPHPGLRLWKVKTTTTKEISIDKNIAQLQMSGALIIRGPYADVASALNAIERALPFSCRIAYVHYSPGRLRIIEEGRP